LAEIDFNIAELRQIAWNQLGIRVPLGVSAQVIHELLQYQRKTVPENGVNTLRDQIMRFISEHPNRLSMPCDGNCYSHTDGVVIYCHRRLLEEIARAT
jgi:hypothetical protein